MPALADPAAIARLGKDVLAARVGGGKVPSGCQGLSLASLQNHPAGKQVAAPKNGELWWVWLEELPVPLTPYPAAPEAGLLARMRPWAPQGELSKPLAEILAGRQSPVLTGDDLGTMISALDVVRLPPCASTSARLAAAKGLYLVAAGKFGYCCEGLERSDFYPARNCAQPAAGTQDEPRDSAAVEAPATAPATPPLSIEELLLADREFERQLFYGLPRLRDGWCALPWATEKPAFAMQRDLRRRFEHLVATCDRLPALSGRLLDSRIRPEIQHLRITASRQAVRALDNALMLIAQADARQVPGRRLLDQMEQRLIDIEQALARRMTPWWEDEA